MKCYYAHCKAIYGTPQEERDIELLESLGFEVVNPNDPIHQERCRNCPGGEMQYFVDLAAGCAVMAFRALPTMEIPAGVFKEVMSCIGHNGPVIELPTRPMSRGIDVELTREYLRDCGQR